MMIREMPSGLLDARLLLPGAVWTSRLFSRRMYARPTTTVIRPPKRMRVAFSTLLAGRRVKMLIAAHEHAQVLQRIQFLRRVQGNGNEVST